MTPFFFLRLGRINNKCNGGLLGAIKHNKRELPTPMQVNSTKTHLNYAINSPQTAEDVVSRAETSMAKVGILKTRKNQVLAVEIIFSLPISWHNKNYKKYFEDCYIWTDKTFQVEILSFDVHLDESASHAHAILLPIINGKLRGSDLIGGVGNLRRLAKLFETEVASRYYSNNGSFIIYKQAEKKIIANMVLKKLKKDVVRKSEIWTWVYSTIMREPIECAQLLGLKF